VFFDAVDRLGARLYQAELAGAAPPRLVLRDSAANLSEPAPSADGGTLYYVRRRSGGGDVHAYALGQPAGPTRAVVATSADESSPRPSPDGRWLAYVSRETGGRQVYVRPTDPARAERWQVSDGFGYAPRWSRDGRELYYIDQNQYDVLPGGAGFLMLAAREEGARRGGRLVFVERWPGLLAAVRSPR
jgi:Tol biopolymer transport system component